MSKLNVQNIHKFDLEYFKTIPINDLDDSKFLDWLFYYEKNDIIKFCFNHPVYTKYIKKNNLLSEYCVGISLEKKNEDIINYLMKKKIIDSNHFLTENNLSYFVLGENNLDYFKNKFKDKNLINKLGNLAIYHVKPDLLNEMILKGFNDLDVGSLLFNIKNTVDIQNKVNVFELLDKHFNLPEIFKINMKEVLENKEIFKSHNQIMDKYIERIFGIYDVGNLFQQNLQICLEIIEIEKNLGKDFFKNKVLLENINEISMEDLQKIKKFNKDFFREIEKAQLYKNLDENLSKSENSRFQGKKHKI